MSLFLFLMEFFTCFGVLRELFILVEAVMGFFSMISLPLLLVLCWVFLCMVSGSCDLHGMVCLIQLFLEGGGTIV
jgi:hypothetical protein